MHVCIRPWTATYAPAIVEALSDAGVTDNLRDGLPSPTPRLTRALHSLRPDGGEGHTLRHRRRRRGSGQHPAHETGQHPPPHGGARLLRRPPSLGQRVCTEAVRQICRFAFAETDLSPRVCGALCGQRRLLPSAGEGWLPA